MSELAILFATARMGFNVVPFAIAHAEKGKGELHMTGEGLRFEPFDKKQEPLAITWEEFDQGPQGGSDAKKQYAFIPPK